MESTTLENRESLILSVENLEVVYNEVILVLRGISLNVSEGEIVALLGANGAGKTTLLRSIMGLIKPAAGNVSIFGQSIHQQKKAIGYMPQRGSVDSVSYTHLTLPTIYSV